MIVLVAAAVLLAEILLIIYLPVIGCGLLALIGLVILLLLFIPMGVHASYIDAVFRLAIKLWAFEIKFFPERFKKSHGEKGSGGKVANDKKSASSGRSKRSQSKLQFSFEELLELAKKGISCFGKFGKLTVHKFRFYYVAAGKDPYSTAMTFNYVNAALSSLAPLCVEKLRVKNDVDVWTKVDFTAEESKLDTELTITLRLIQVLRVAVIVGWGFLLVLLKNKKRTSKQRKQAALEESNKSDTNTENTMNTEERMDSNGE